jgi:trimethylamine--corrinoid protein Co-methyltransferase
MTAEVGAGARTRLDGSTYLRPLPWKHAVEVLPPEAIVKLHDNTLAILEQVGVKMGSKAWLERMADSGARVDFAEERVWFPPGLVEEKIKMAPATFELAARDPALDLRIGSGNVYLSTDGCVPDVLDLATGERRKGTKRDLSEITRLADALPQISFHWQPVSATDTPDYVRPLHEIEAQLSSTSKHIQQMTVVDPWNARGMVEMLEVVAGGKEALRARPLMSNFQCCISPLSWEGEPLEAIDVLAQAGIPVGICSMPIACATAPATMAGLMSVMNAEILSGITALQIAYPGHPTWYIPYATSMDLNTGALNLGWGPEELTSEMAGAQIGRHYGIPTITGVFGSGAKTANWQAGVQNGMSAFGKVFSPADMVTAAGTLVFCNAYSMEELVLDAEIWDIAWTFAKGFDFDEETLAFDAIAEVGPANHFLGSQHTRDHMLDFWRSGIFDRDAWEDWEAKGKPDPVDNARRKMNEILNTHEPLPLEDDMLKELSKIVDAYQAERAEEDD